MDSRPRTRHGRAEQAPAGPTGLPSTASRHQPMGAASGSCRAEKEARGPARAPPVASGRPSCPPAGLGHYLGAREDDSFLQVLQHEGEHGGREGHGVRAVNDQEAVVPPVVSLRGAANSGRPPPEGERKGSPVQREGGREALVGSWPPLAGKTSSGGSALDFRPASPPGDSQGSQEHRSAGGLHQDSAQDSWGALCHVTPASWAGGCRGE